jgi:hypothetical protein
VSWDWRILLNGKADEMMYEHGAFVTGGMSFTELKQRSLIDDRAKAADASPDFSDLIRVGLPAPQRRVAQ